ncbi:hypothetical protein [Glaciecola sp. 1036]|uniref:hypothetical protein n=1 Tax=Alteromonadaceae TaxID=72275 RepID=UPI003D0183E7
MEATTSRIKWQCVALFLLTVAIIVIGRQMHGAPTILGDDMWGTTAVLGNPYEVVVFTLRWDLHPPFYYMLLDLWAIVSKSDTWLSLSSTVTHATLVSFVYWYVVRVRKNFFGAVIAATLTFCSPLLLEYSAQIRMYPLIALISFFLFYLIEEHAKGKSSVLKWIFLLEILLVYTHAIGLLFVFSHFCFGAYLVIKNKNNLIKWVLLHALLFVFSLPAIANSLVRSVSHTKLPSFEQTLGAVGNMFASGPVYAVIIPILIMLWALAYKNHRAIILCYLFTPILIYSAISLLMKPMWLDRNFIFAIPMLSITLGVFLTKFKVNRLLMMVLLVVLSVNNFSHWKIKDYAAASNSFDQVIAFLNSRIAASEQKICIISADKMSTFWTLERYLVGTDWGNPMEVQPPLNERWGQLKQHLPSPVPEILMLKNTVNYTESQNLIIASGYAKRCEAEASAATYYVTIASDESYPEKTQVFANNTWKVLLLK